MCVSGGKKCKFFGKLCVHTKSKISKSDNSGNQNKGVFTTLSNIYNVTFSLKSSRILNAIFAKHRSSSFMGIGTASKCELPTEVGFACSHDSVKKMQKTAEKPFPK